MQRHRWRLFIGLLFVAGCLAQTAAPPHPLTWQETEARFRANNPTLLAGKVSVQESRADEITAYLRPNPDMTLGWDQLTPFNTNPYRPVWQSYLFWNFDYLHERQHKRELRLESAQKATAIAISNQSDLERNLMFNLRDAFVRVLHAKAIVAISKDNLSYYDKQIEINRTRYEAGDMSRVDFQRVQLQRVQFE